MEKTLRQVKKKNFSYKFQLALIDIIEGLKNWRIWLAFARQDIQHRYRRSALGPIWITLSTCIMVLSLGCIYGTLFKADLGKYFPYISSGIVIWTFFSTTILEFTETLVESSSFIKQIKLPFTTYILRVLIRNYIVLAHNMVVLIPLLVYFRIHVNFFGVLFGFIVISISAISFGMILALFGARFRDVRPIIQNLIQLIFYVTPIMWMPEMLPKRFVFVVDYNPLYQLVELLRAPMIGNFPSTYSVISASIIAIIGFVMMIYLFTRYRQRIAFWI